LFCHHSTKVYPKWIYATEGLGFSYVLSTKVYNPNNFDNEKLRKDYMVYAIYRK